MDPALTARATDVEHGRCKALGWRGVSAAAPDRSAA